MILRIHDRSAIWKTTSVKSIMIVWRPQLVNALRLSSPSRYLPIAFSNCRYLSTTSPSLRLALPSLNETSDHNKAIYEGVASGPYPPETIKILTSPVDGKDLEIHEVKGWVYLAESKYIDLLDKAFGRAGWSLEPRGDLKVTSPSGKTAFRTYILRVHGRFVSEAIGDWELSRKSGLSTDEVERKCWFAATLGVASELWDKTVADGLKEKWFERKRIDDGSGKKTLKWVKKKA
ncbi:mitochondrial genome maintenance MGM101-domain-containing protein [Chytridium lagenaria]|nr:mitochondrial genome maintenance MGM101-domain-containing protein [Chytridium lagenaria]